MSENFNPDLPLGVQQIIHDEMASLIALLNGLNHGLYGAVVMVLCNEEGAIHWDMSATPGGRKNSVIGILDAAQQILRGDGEEDEDED